ncbi:MAG: VanZ family protein [Bryobacteraceae bacterium]
MKTWWLAVLGWIGVIFFSSTSTASLWCESAFSFLSGIFISNVPRDSTSFGAIHLAADKGLHVTLFAVLALLLYRAMANPRHKIIRILSFGLVVGCCSEYLQSFFPDRDPAIRDVFINLSGTGLGIVLHLLWSRPAGTGIQEAQEYTLSRSDGQ